MTFADRLEELRKAATELPWCAETVGEKGDGANIIGVAFHPDDIDAERPMSGWIQDYDDDGNEIDYVRDEEIAQLEHCTRNHYANTEFIMLLANNADAILELVRAADHLSCALDTGERNPDGTQRGVRNPERDKVERMRNALAKLNGEQT